MNEWALQVAAVAFALYAGILLWIAISDVRRFRIPNIANGLLLLLFLPTALLLPQEVDWLSHGGAAFAVFVVTAGFFLLGWFGGGDVKMFTALALWSGFSHLLEMLFLVSLAGGALAVTAILLRRLAPRFCPTTDTPHEIVWPRFLNKGQKIPYGAAISVGALIMGFHLPLFAPLFG